MKTLTEIIEEINIIIKGIPNSNEKVYPRKNIMMKLKKIRNSLIKLKGENGK